MRMARWSVWAAGALAAAVALSACGDEKEASAAPPQAPSPVPAPNLAMKILSVTIPPGDAVRPVIRFSVTDAKGNPIDLTSEIQASTASPAGVPNTVPRFTLAQMDDRGNYTSYYAATVSPKAYTPPPGVTTPPPTSTVTQASYEPPAAAPWPVGDLKNVGAGTWEFTMPTTNVAGLDRTKTHTAAGWTVRTTATGQDIAHASFNFVPQGNATPAKFETITDEGCNRCHGVLTAHGTRQGTQMCITCHSPQTSDPETSRTVNFKVMIHKIHTGSDLPSVQQGQPYYIVGFQQNVSDFSGVGFPWKGGVGNACVVCHQGANADNWKNNPSFTACTSCHDNVKFNSGEASTACSSLPANQSFQNCMHDGGPITITDQDDVSTCAGCHGPGTAAAVDKFHDRG